ncbi:RDD family protein [Panacagrimonas sp.]|uniref:RDD family protein n=1 Tax=Panacagrimonas sp. TaxID=2480088 RepID=UPI003B515E97
MSNLIVPAPLWRRLASATYDGLLLLGLWMAAALIEVIVRQQMLGLPRSAAWMQLYFFAIGLGFFGWSWTRGGQTLGMHAWRLQVRRLDAASLRWPIALLRYTAMLTTWAVVLTPGLLLIPRYAQHDAMRPIALACVLVTVVAAAWMRADARRRAPCDWVSGTEVVQLPRAQG